MISFLLLVGTATLFLSFAWHFSGKDVSEWSKAAAWRYTAAETPRSRPSLWVVGAVLCCWLVGEVSLHLREIVNNYLRDGGSDRTSSYVDSVGFCLRAFIFSPSPPACPPPRRLPTPHPPPP